MGGSGISWTICKQFAPRSRQITTPTLHHSIFTGRTLFLPPNQQRHSTEGIIICCSRRGKNCERSFSETSGNLSGAPSDRVSSADCAPVLSSPVHRTCCCCCCCVFSEEIDACAVALCPRPVCKTAAAAGAPARQ